MNRRDWFLGRLHVIRRGHSGHPQCGCLLWGVGQGYTPTLDVWVLRTLWTFRWVR